MKELEECRSLLKQRTQELLALQQAARVFGSMARGENVYLHLTEQAAKLLNAEMCAILLYDEKEKALISQAPAYGLTEEQARSYRISLANEEIWRLWEENEYLVLNDVPASPLVDMLGLRPLAEELKVRSTLLVLMRLEGRSLGVIQPSNKLDGSPFNENDVRLLSIFASQVAAAVENARLRQEEQRRLEQAETMARIGMTLASSLDLSAVLDTIAEGALRLVRASYVNIFLYDEENEEFTLRLGVWENGERKTPPPPHKRGLMTYVLASEEPVVIHRVMEHPLYQGEEGMAILAQFPGLEAVAAFPIRRAGKKLGAFATAFTRPHTFSQEELDILSSLANQVAIVVENAQALAKLRASYEAQERLLQLIRELSTPLVPLTKEILLLPLVGSIDSQRAQQIMSTLLEGVAGRRARAVIMDITGVPMVDSRVANHLIQAARAAKLLGAEVILVGITPQVAQTVVELGLDLSELVPRSELQDGIEYALRLVGHRIIKTKE